MKIYKIINQQIIIESNGNCFISTAKSWDAFINRDDLWEQLQQEIKDLPAAGDLSWLQQQELLVPIGTQEVWAAGVTYLRSKTARMEESKESGAATFYDKVYDAERPELFFKATAPRVIATGGLVRIRKDSSWNVPEPELTLVLTSSGEIIGYTIGNDMSSRSIEGENPLYLPQAKMYNGSAAIGPCILVTEKPIPPSTRISIKIQREGKYIYEGSVAIDQMKREHTDLAAWLFKEYSFPSGAYLMTGTCLVPGNEFTLHSQDEIIIAIDGIGQLINKVE